MNVQNLFNLVAASALVFGALLGLGLFLETEVFERKQQKHHG